MELFQKPSLQRRNLRAGLQNPPNLYDLENYDIYIAHILTRMRSWAMERHNRRTDSHNRIVVTCQLAVRALLAPFDTNASVEDVCRILEMALTKDLAVALVPLE